MLDRLHKSMPVTPAPLLQACLAATAALSIPTTSALAARTRAAPTRTTAREWVRLIGSNHRTLQTCSRRRSAVPNRDLRLPDAQLSGLPFVWYMCFPTWHRMACSSPTTPTVCLLCAPPSCADNYAERCLDGGLCSTVNPDDFCQCCDDKGGKNGDSSCKSGYSKKCKKVGTTCSTVNPDVSADPWIRQAW